MQETPVGRDPDGTLPPAAVLLVACGRDSRGLECLPSRQGQRLTERTTPCRQSPALAVVSSRDAPPRPRVSPLPDTCRRESRPTRRSTWRSWAPAGGETTPSPPSARRT